MVAELMVSPVEETVTFPGESFVHLTKNEWEDIGATIRDLQKRLTATERRCDALRDQIDRNNGRL